MNDFLKQIGIGFIMLICMLIAVLAIVVVWTCALIYEGIKWVVTYGIDREKPKAKVLLMTDGYKTEVSPEYLKDYKATFTIAKTPRHNLRGKNGRFIKRTIEVEPARTPVTRYGASPTERFANQT